MRFSRKQVLDRLEKQIDMGKALLLFGAGTGLTARSAEMGGADLIAVYSTAIYRMRGLPSLLAFLPYSDANQHLLDMAREILPAVRNTPCIAGIGAHNPALELDRFVDDVLDMGFSGVTNEPFAGIYGAEFAEQLESAGIGLSREVDLIGRARLRDIFTIAWVFTPEEAAKMADAGADVIGAHVGVTAGGLTGARNTLGLEEAAAAVQEMCAAAKRARPGVILITHGGPFKDPETAEYSIRNTDAVGYAAGSSGERTPTEKAVSGVTGAYKSIQLR